ncbi:MAG TPA: HD-GYP domain-containing protein [Candidatus Dormibacteraeota bacterium]
MIVNHAQARRNPGLDVRIAAVVSLTAAAAILVNATWIAAWHGSVLDRWPLLVLLIALGATASHFPVELTPKFKTNTATAVHFAILLLYPPPVAIAAVGLAVLAGNGSLALRRNHLGQRRRGVYDTVFNVAQTMIATSAAATVLYAGRPQQDMVPLVPADAWAIPAAAAMSYVTTTFLVSAIVGIQTSRNPWHVFLATQRIDVPAEAALYLIGFVTAILALSRPWAPLVMVIPTAVVYLSTKRAVLLHEQTIAAVEAMADMVDKRDRYTAEHSMRVAANVAVIAPAMGLSPEEVSLIRLAARVHDLGKIALPDSILGKDGKLTGGEFALMKEHPRHGWEILSRFPQYHRGRDIVLSHHERIDGRGYPRGLRGNQIPLGAQIVAVADALDAMTSDRPYRAALPLHQAMTELRLGRGTQWSAAVVDTVDRLLNVENRELSFGTVGALSTT